MPRPDVQVDTSGINRSLRNMPSNRRLFVKRVAFEVEARAKQDAPVDTGALRASIYTRTDDSEEMPIIEGDEQRSELPKPDEDTAHVGPSVEYGLYRELGTADAAATPYLVPAAMAVEHNLRQFLDDFQRMAEGR